MAKKHTATITSDTTDDLSSLTIEVKMSGPVNRARLLDDIENHILPQIQGGNICGEVLIDDENDTTIRGWWTVE